MFLNSSFHSSLIYYSGAVSKGLKMKASVFCRMRILSLNYFHSAAECAGLGGKQLWALPLCAPAAGHWENASICFLPFGFLMSSSINTPFPQGKSSPCLFELSNSQPALISPVGVEGCAMWQSWLSHWEHTECLYSSTGALDPGEARVSQSGEKVAPNPALGGAWEAISVMGCLALLCLTLRKSAPL